MNIFPAIDLYGGQAVRLLKGNYEEMTVYNADPTAVVRDFISKGAEYLHLVDLEGAKTGQTPALEAVKKILSVSSLFTEIGGGIRSMETVERYFSAGVDRVILGTAAVTDENFLRRAVDTYREKIAVGVDLKDGYVAIRGWTQKSSYTGFEFCEKMEKMGVKTVICTDVSRDGAMQGTNRALYGELSECFDMQIVASGGISTIDDLKALRKMNLYGAIVGKAYYTGAIDLKEAIEVAK